jgi:S-adenosyl-L-methionine hydrolase (adenosine-forming)
MRPLITLTTDFGISSPYVAQMKGVMLSLCREVDLVDVTHAIAPQNIKEGAVVLADTTPRFPPGTIHVAVVDPGVGSSRQLVYAEIGAQRYLAPDNGLLGLLGLLAAASWPTRMIALENRDYWLPEISHTFHGRDILAPVAAHLANGLDPALLGQPLAALESVALLKPRKTGGGLVGEVLYVDSFGNAITNIRRDDLPFLGDLARVSIEFAGGTFPHLVANYAAGLQGETIALFDSQDRLEIAVVGGSAAQKHGIAAGEPVRVTGNL